MREPRKVRRRMARGACALVLFAGVAGGGSSGVGWAGAGDQLWEARYNGPGNAHDRGNSLAPSPDGTRVFVTGESYAADTGSDYATFAYDPWTGAQIWEARYNGPGSANDFAKSLAPSPDGTRVFVTGASGGDYGTIAYDAQSGAQLWEARYNGPGDGFDGAVDLAASPDGGRVFVTGRSYGAETHYDYATIAYDAASGAHLWDARYNGPANSEDAATSLASSPDGTAIFVTGLSDDSRARPDYSTIAYDASSGTRLWEARYNGPGNDSDRANSLAASPDGTRIFVTGESYAAGTGSDYTTVAYDAASGAEVWDARYNGPGNDDDSAYSLASNPDGTRIFVTGESDGDGTGPDYATVAYDAASGAEVWDARYNGPGNSSDSAHSLAPSPDGTRIFVTGYSPGPGTGYDYATIAYDAPSGAQLWEARYNGPGNDYDQANSLAPSPDGSHVFVTGYSDGSGPDYATVAYDTGLCTPGNDAKENGPLSGPVHSTVEPATGGLRPTVHQVNCDLIAANGL